MGDCGKETWFCCSVTHARYAQTCIADTISIKISCARYFFFKKNPSYPMQCCLAKALAWMTQIRTRIRVCQRIMKTSARLGPSSCIRHNFKQFETLSKFRAWSESSLFANVMIKETDIFKTDHGYSIRSRASCQWPWRVKINITYEKISNSKYITALVAVCRNIIFNNERIIWGKHFASYQDLFSNLYKMYQLFRIGHCLEILFFALTWR